MLDQYFVKRAHYWALNLQFCPFSSDFRALGYKYTPPQFSRTHSVLFRRVSESRSQECQLSFIKHNFFRQESEGTAGCVLLVSENQWIQLQMRISLVTAELTCWLSVSVVFLSAVGMSPVPRRFLSIRERDMFSFPFLIDLHVVVWELLFNLVILTATSNRTILLFFPVPKSQELGTLKER
jgi:hypothetical protein